MGRVDTPIRHPLAYARITRGWSQADLARLIRQAAERRGLRSGAIPQRVSKWESGRVIPDDESQDLLAEVFGIDPGTVRALGWPNWLPGMDTPLPLGPYSNVPALREALRTTMDLYRRTFTAYTGAALAGLALQWATDEPHAVATALRGRRVDADFVTMLEDTSKRLATLATEQRQHAHRLLDAHLHTVTDLIAEGRHTKGIGKRLNTLAASLAQTLGWYRFDQGDHAGAGKLWHGALHSAHATGDRDLGAGVLADFAYQSLWLNQPKDAVDVLEYAIRRADHPMARSVLHLRLGRAHAALGEELACSRALAAAEHHLGAPAADPAPTWCVWMCPSDLAVDSGRCLLDLGHRRSAHQLIQDGTKVLPVARTKTKAVFLAYEAEAYLRDGEFDRAAATATQALTTANRIGAPRCVELVHGLLPAFSGHASDVGVGELLELARAS
ncbi:XRE family transcriptional regulator [Streptomyces klenkii]|uniref:XRE family transcriptional regulator n=1 Tax=Streptomyces klenkii TaxID=1420899 RepID=A0A3B0AGW9_9ACTN|nr:XRE family transcriptional regulator [Streptomyces klenkii]